MNFLPGVPADLDRSTCFFGVVGITLAMSAALKTVIAMWFCLITFDMARLASFATRAYL